MNKSAVAVIRINSYREAVVVGHVTNSMSKIVITFRSLLHCALDIFLNGKWINHGEGYRLEIPANFYFYNPEEAINWFKNELNKTEKKFKENMKHCLK